MSTLYRLVLLTIWSVLAAVSAQALPIGNRIVVFAPPAGRNPPRLSFATKGFFIFPSSPDNWLGGTGNWSNGSDWSSGLPGTGSDVVIGTGNDYVTLDTNASINSLTIGGVSGASTLIGSSSTGYTVNIAGSLTVNQTGTLTLGFDSLTAAFDSTNKGMMNLTDSGLQFSATFVNSGNIELYGLDGIQVGGVFTNAGSIIDNDGPSSLTVSGNMNNSGLILMGAVNVIGTLTNQTGGSINVMSLSVNGDLVNEGQVIGLVRGNTFSINGTLLNSGSFDVSYSQATVGSLNNSGSVQVGGLMTVQGNAINSGGIDEYYIGPSGGQSLNVGGTLTNTSTGYIEIYGPYIGGGAANINNAGTIAIDNGASFSGGTVTNSGTFALGQTGGGNQLALSGRFTNAASGTFSLGSVSDVANIAYITNAGTINVANGSSLNVTGGGNAPVSALPGFLNSGIVTIAQGGSLTSPLSYSQTGGQTTVDGTLRIGGRGVVNLAGGSVYGNEGTIQGTIISNANVNIGDTLMTVGELAFVGNYTQGANGSLTFDIAGTSPTQYDQLNISGHAHLNGLMTIDLLHGFIPQIGNTFDIVNFAGGSGAFSTVLGLPINGQEHFVLQYNSNNVMLDVVSGGLAGASSLSAGISASEAFITEAGANDPSRFAATLNPSASTPEPESIILFFTGLASLSCIGRRRVFKSNGATSQERPSGRAA